MVCGCWGGLRFIGYVEWNIIIRDIEWRVIELILDRRGGFLAGDRPASLLVDSKEPHPTLVLHLVFAVGEHDPLDARRGLPLPVGILPSHGVGLLFESLGLFGRQFVAFEPFRPSNFLAVVSACAVLGILALADLVHVFAFEAWTASKDLAFVVDEDAGATSNRLPAGLVLVIRDGSVVFPLFRLVWLDSPPLLGR